MELLQLDQLFDLVGARVPEVVAYTQRLPRNVAAAIRLFDLCTPELIVGFAVFGLVCFVACFVILLGLVCYVLFCSPCCARRRHQVSHPCDEAYARDTAHLEYTTPSPSSPNYETLTPLVMATTIGALPSSPRSPMLENRFNDPTTRVRMTVTAKVAPGFSSPSHPKPRNTDLLLCLYVL